MAGRASRVDIGTDGRFLVDGEVVAAEIAELVAGRQWAIRLGGSRHEVTLLTLDPLRLAVDGTEVEASAIDERTGAATRGTRRATTGRLELRAPMPGLLKKVHVSEGDIVERDAPLVTLEAMKMENELRAPGRARVVRLMAAAGAKVEGGAVLVVLSEAEGPRASGASAGSEPG